MDSPGPSPLPMERWADFNFPVLSTNSELPDIDNWVSSQSLETCCSDDSRSLPSPVEGCSSFSVTFQSRSSDDADSAAYTCLTWDLNSPSKESFHSPREYGFPESPSSSTVLLACPPSWLESQPQLEDEIVENNQDQVPLSSSPPEFTSSSPTSDISSELAEKEGSSSLTSASSGVFSDTASISASQHLDRELRPDQFSQRLHELLLSVVRSRELERSRTRDEGTDFTTCTSRSGDSGSSSTGFENSGNDKKAVVAKIRTSAPSVIRSPTIISRWFLDQGLVATDSNKTSDILSRSSPSLSYVLDHSRSSDQRSQKTDDVADISPIRFEIPSGTLRVLSNIPTETAKAYRIIKRSRSFVIDDKLQDTPMPLTKRQKTQREHGVHARDRLYASRAASLRRADSLKSVQAAGDGKTPTRAGCVPTVPATPVVASQKVTKRKVTASARPLRSPVPIIAPPPDYVPKLPLSAETLAKTRLGKFLERERRGREKDGLPVNGWEYPQSSVDSDDDDDDDGIGVREKALIEWDMMLGIGQHARETVVDWLLHVMPAPLPKEMEISALSAHSSVPGSFSSSRSGSTTSSSTSMDRQPTDLMDQLKNSPETRFHAAWMFLRYFHLIMSPNRMGPRNGAGELLRQSSLNSNMSASTDQEGRDLMIWDTAVACMALSVKFHRDFLDPLLPVYAHEYLSLAPQRLSYEDLETAQRDVLSAFDYCIGVTPQPVMDELWFSLESLRSLLNFDNGWEASMADAWRSLFDAVCEPDVQIFSISTLAAVAIMDGIVESLVQRYSYEATLKSKAATVSIPNRSSRETRRRRRGESRKDSIDRIDEPELVASSRMDTDNNLKVLSRNWGKYVRKAERASEGVICDIQALVGITDAQLRDCRNWFSGLY